MSREGEKPGGSPWTVQRTTDLLKGRAGNELRALMQGAAILTLPGQGGFTLRIRDGVSSRSRPRKGRTVLRMTPGADGTIESMDKPGLAMDMVIPARAGSWRCRCTARAGETWRRPPGVARMGHILHAGNRLGRRFIEANRKNLFGSPRRGPRDTASTSA